MHSPVLRARVVVVSSLRPNESKPGGQLPADGGLGFLGRQGWGVTLLDRPVLIGLEIPGQEVFVTS